MITEFFWLAIPLMTAVLELHEQNLIILFSSMILDDLRRLLYHATCVCSSIYWFKKSNLFSLTKSPVSVQVIKIIILIFFFFLNRWFPRESLAECYVFTSGSGERSKPSSRPHSWPQVPWIQSDGNPDWDDHQLLTHHLLTSLISINKYKHWVE